MSDDNKGGFNAAIFLPLVAAFTLCALLTTCGSYYTIPVGDRGVKVTWGKMDEQNLLKPGLGFKMPFITGIRTMMIRQDTREVKAICFSSDLQQITCQVKVLWRTPESSVIPILRDYWGDPFDKLVSPRVQEAFKEVVALKTAADIVKTREQVKVAALDGSRKKVSGLLEIDDLVIENIDLSDELEHAIEQKMVQQQDAEKAIFRKQQAQTDAETAVIFAKGQAESIRIQGEALEKNPKLVDLKMVEKWDGHSPQVVGSGSVMLNMGK